MDMGLKGSAVLVTGGSGGIGRSIALAFAAEGANVAVTYHRQPDAADAVVKEIEAAGTRAIAVRLDLASLDRAAAVVDEVVQAFGGLDVLVNNAVFWEEWRPSIEEWTRQDWQPALRANIEGVFELTQRAVPALRRSPAGRIVFISSTLTERGMIGCWSYATAKAAGHGLARGLAWDLGRDGVLVNTVSPGMVLVDGRHRTASEEELAELAKAQPAGRLPTSEDVANATVYLASRVNRSITGEVLRVCGGTP